MNGGNGRKAQLFQRVIRDARHRQQIEKRPVADKEIKANEVEKMHVRIESAFRAVKAA